ncbi:MAG: type I-E CRISPR-associated endonuclease Cas1e [Promethearchaeota archaeon]
MRRDLRDSVRFEDGFSFLYVERCNVHRGKLAVEVVDEGGVVPLPSAQLSLLLLGPGTSVTHAAVQALADDGCLVAWTGEQGTRFYAFGTGGTHSSKNVARQALLCSHPDLRREVVRRMYSKRFGEELGPDVTVAQMRGMEGARVKRAYREASEEYGVPWSGRKYDRSDWGAADPVNRALSAANACLYGVCHAAILAAGFSPALGFIHVGTALSFVYDVADFYKLELSVPVAFEVAKESPRNVGSRARKRMRDLFHETGLLKRVVPDLFDVLDVDVGAAAGATSTGATATPSPAAAGSASKFHEMVADLPAWAELESPWDADPALPGGLWDPDVGTVPGGTNHAEGDDSESGASVERANGDSDSYPESYSGPDSDQRLDPNRNPGGGREGGQEGEREGDSGDDRRGVRDVCEGVVRRA